MVLYHNNVNIITCHISPSQQQIVHEVMLSQIAIGLMFGSSALAENK